MRVLELQTGKVLWAATGTKMGGASDNTSAVALKLLDTMIHELGSGQ